MKTGQVPALRSDATVQANTAIAPAYDTQLWVRGDSPATPPPCGVAGGSGQGSAAADPRRCRLWEAMRAGGFARVGAGAGAGAVLELL